MIYCPSNRVEINTSSLILLVQDYLDTQHRKKTPQKKKTTDKYPLLESVQKSLSNIRKVEATNMQDEWCNAAPENAGNVRLTPHLRKST